MNKLPTLPAPDARDTPEVRSALALATRLWESQLYADALPYLLNAALIASSRAPTGDARVIELARAATEASAFANSPGSIPISLGAMSGEDRRLTPPAVAETKPVAPAPPPKRVRKGTLPEEMRPAPDTVRVNTDVPPPPTIDLTGTVPQGYSPAPTTRRVDGNKKP